jgi:hypothetical protein
MSLLIVPLTSQIFDDRKCAIATPNLPQLPMIIASLCLGAVVQGSLPRQVANLSHIVLSHLNK